MIILPTKEAILINRKKKKEKKAGPNFYTGQLMGLRICCVYP